MPVRKIKPSYMTSTGVVSSLKSDGFAAFESTLERDFLTTLEFSPEVSGFEVQPVAIFWADTSGRSRRYTPDVLITFAPESNRLPVLAEIKYSDELRDKWTDLAPKFEAARLFAASKGWVFRIVTERHIRSNFGRNAGLLLPYVRRGLSNPDHWPTLGRTIAKAGRIEIQDLLESIFPSAIERAYLIPSLWYLIGTFRIGVDFSRPLTMGCEVWVIPGLRHIESALDRYNVLVRGAKVGNLGGN